MSTAGLAVAAVTLLALATPAPAPAHAQHGHATAADQITEVVAIGETFWHDRNVQPCPNPQITIAPPALMPQQNADGAAQLGGCQIWIRQTLAREAATERARPGTGGDSAREILCLTVIHELGHTAGLEHTASGVMSPTGPVPWVCAHWRAQLDRTAHVSRHHHRGHGRSRAAHRHERHASH